VSIEEGTLWADYSFICTVNSGGTLGSTDVTWATIKVTPIDGSITGAKLNDSVINDLTLAAIASDDYLPFADKSDGNKKKRGIVSDLTTSLGASVTYPAPTINGAPVQWTNGTGFLSVTITNSNSGTNIQTKFEVFCDASPTPTDRWGSGYFYGHEAANWSDSEPVTLNFPISNNDYYRIIKTDNVGSSANSVSPMLFRPLKIL
jgi:hypothetical protein